MSESVGLKELLRRKIDKLHSEMDCAAALESTNRHLSSSVPFPDLHVPGAKDDKAKPMAGVLLDFSRALQTVVDVGTYGAKKYTRTGWATVPEGSQRYTDAMMRHLLAMDVDPDGLDKETGLPHLAHVAWNALAVLELQARRKETY